MSDLVPVRTVAPSVSPVTLAEAKAQCRVDHSDDDTLMQSLIDSAASMFDGYRGALGRAMITQTWQQDFSAFDDAMRLPVGDLIAVSSVSYYDADNASQTLSADVYAAFTDLTGPYVTLKAGQSWPAAYDRRDAVRITWTAGYGPAATDVPMAIRHAVLLLVGHWYANRETVNIGNISSELPFATKALISQFRRVEV